ncbi:hypothetical protein BDD12DRAFT_805790 [Trichophaea hybrida]|nr:hypothetical protein BDD12DRAFT_805790 [Trichophaea hybrida]
MALFTTPRLCAKPAAPDWRIFTSDLHVNYTKDRDAWFKGISRVYKTEVEVWERECPAKPNTEHKLENETMASEAASPIQKEIMYHSMLYTMKFEGTTPGEGFLKKFELARNQLMAANPQTTPDIFLLYSSAALHDPIHSLPKGQDEMVFVGSSTWLDKIVGRIHLEKYGNQTLLMERVPLSIAKKLTESNPQWQDFELSDLKKRQIAYNILHRNPDPVLRHCKEMDVEKSARMHRMLLTNLNLEAKKRWAYSDDAKRKDHKPIQEESDCLDIGTVGSLVIVPAHVQKNVQTGMRMNVSRSIKKLRRMTNTSIILREVQIFEKTSSSEPRRSSAKTDDMCTFMYPGLDYSINKRIAMRNIHKVNTSLQKKSLFREFPEN